MQPPSPPPSVYTMILTWRDGIEVAPDGEPAREFVQRRVWSSSVWITRSGAAYRRYYNPHTQSVTWQLMPLAEDAEGALGYHIHGLVPLARAIARAWLHGSGPVFHVEGEPLDVMNVTFTKEEEAVVALDDEEETWRPLRWACGLVPCPNGYHISSLGRLRSPQGEATYGFAALGTRWAAVKGAGLVDLHAAAGLARAEVHVPPRVYEAYLALVGGDAPEEHARRVGISVKVAWDYYNLAAPLVPRLRSYVEHLVTPNLWSVLDALRGTSVLGGPLKKLRDTAQEHLDVSFEELRLARTALNGDAARD